MRAKESVSGEKESRPTRGAWIEIHDDIQRRHGEGGRSFVEHAD